jgi:hypothetical protein
VAPCVDLLRSPAGVEDFGLSVIGPRLRVIILLPNVAAP